MVILWIAAIAWCVIALCGVIAATREAQRQHIAIPAWAVVLAAFVAGPPLLVLTGVGMVVKLVRSKTDESK